MKLARYVFMITDISDLSPSELLQIIKPLYALEESADFLYAVKTKFQTYEKLMTQSSKHFFSIFRTLMDKLVCLSGSYLDDIIESGTREEKEINQK